MKTRIDRQNEASVEIESLLLSKYGTLGAVQNLSDSAQEEIAAVACSLAHIFGVVEREVDVEEKKFMDQIEQPMDEHDE